MVLTRVKIAEIVENISNVKSQRTLVNDCIQIALDRIFQFHDFPFYLTEDVIQTVDDYSTGTIAVTKGSADIVGTLTVWTSAMEGRKIRISNDRAYYKIKTVTSNTQITLDAVYQGEDDTAATYVIYKDEYRLKPDVYKYKVIRQMENGVPLRSFHPTDFDRQFPSPEAYGDATREILIGSKLDTYSTGTVTIVANSTTITGTTTTWASLEGLDRMSRIRIGENVYHIKSVDSDTQITTYETMTTGVTGSTYEIELANLVVQLYLIPNAQKSFRYRYFRMPVPLCNNYDVADIPYGWQRLLILGALSEILSQKGDINKAENVYEVRFMQGLQQMKLTLGSFTPDRKYCRKSQDRIRGIDDYLEAPNTDRRWSLPAGG